LCFSALVFFGGIGCEALGVPTRSLAIWRTAWLAVKVRFFRFFRFDGILETHALDGIIASDAAKVQ
jgi:hypothetical protein